MKYRQLTKEQLAALHQEFSQFLATQQIDVKEWEIIKKENPQMAEEELNIFSDVVWEDVLNKTKYLEHISEYHVNLFQCTSKEIIRIYIKCTNTSFSFLNEKDYEYFFQNPLADDFEYFKASKKYTIHRNSAIFELIEMGSQISEGELFDKVKLLIG